MATVIYRYENGELETHRVECKHLQSHLDSGWSLTKDTTPTKEEADTNDTGKLSTKEIREAAKTAGIEGWDKKRVSTLKAELGYD